MRGAAAGWPACEASTTCERVGRRHALQHRGEGEDLVVVHVADVDVDPLDPGRPGRPPSTTRRLELGPAARRPAAAPRARPPRSRRRPPRLAAMPSSTIERRSSGSSTAASAAWTSSSIRAFGLPSGFPLRTIGRIPGADGARRTSTADEFNAAVSAVTSAFGDPTRREIYLFARDAGAAGVTAGEVAERFDLHPNVARHHLEKLTGGGYLDVEIASPPSTAARAAGRPVEALPRRSARRHARPPPRHDDLLGGLLARALDAARPRAGRGARRRGRLRVRHARSPRAWSRPKGTAR